MIASPRPLLSHPKISLLVQAGALVAFVFVLIPVLSGGQGQLFLAAVVGGIFAFWIVLSPHWGVLIILTAWFIEIDAAAVIPYLVTAILLIPLCLSVLQDRGTWLLQIPQMRIFLAIGLLLLVSTVWNEFKYPITLFPEKDQTVRQLLLFGTRLAWLIFFLYFITTRRKIVMTVWLVVGLIIVAASSALLSLLKGGGDYRAAAAFSLADNSNRLAYISLFATALLWYYRFHGQSPRLKALTLPFLLLLPMTALTAGSRSGLLQMGALAVFVVKDQKGWSATKRIYAVCFLGIIALLISAVIPSVYLMRATSFDPDIEAPGQKSLQHRIEVIVGALDMIASDPVFGVGIGNSGWVARAFFNTGGNTHNSYLWAFNSGGLGVFALYLSLFYVTYRMLQRLEQRGPPELLWLSKGMQVNLILFMLFSAFADFWLSDFLYVIVGLTIVMTLVSQREAQKLASTRLRGSVSMAGSRS